MGCARSCKSTSEFVKNIRAFDIVLAILKDVVGDIWENWEILKNMLMDCNQPGQTVAFWEILGSERHAQSKTLQAMLWGAHI